MLGWMRRREGRVDYETPPAELPGQHAQAYAKREKEIRDVDRSIREAWHFGELALVDRLLDMRNAIRPPRPAQVPVIPGRSS